MKMQRQRQISLFNATATRCISMRKFITKKKIYIYVKSKAQNKNKKKYYKK